MPNNQEDHDKLKKKLIDARKVIDAHKLRYHRVQAELTSIEDDLVAAREAELKANEGLTQFEYSQTNTDADEDDRIADINRFTGLLPGLLKRLEDEDNAKKKVG